MKTTIRLTLATALIVGLTGACQAANPAASSAAAPAAGVVNSDNLNVRGQAKVASEVVTRLKKGESVTILEEVNVAKPKKGEPAKWLRIAMPANTPVWVNAGFIDATEKTVKPRRLNLRSGPGENYSVLGRIEQGTTVKVVRQKGEWLEIEPPEGSYGFVAAGFVTPTPAAVAQVTPAPAPPTPAVTAPAPPPTVTTVTPAPQPVIIEPAPPTQPTTVTTTPPTVPPTPTVAEARTEPLPGDQETKAREALNKKYAEMEVERGSARKADAVALARAEPWPKSGKQSLPKRVVTREGVVRPTVSIQAPTYFALENLDTHRIMNFLYSSSTNLNVGRFNNSRVIVSGEEALDKRWPNIPVLKVDSVVVLP